MWQRWSDKAREKKLVHAAPSPMTYPVLCLRLGEALAFVSLCGSDPDRAEAIASLRKVVVTERGFEHPLGDWYAVSSVAIVRALVSYGKTDVARDYLLRLSSWVLNMYAKRVGLADIWSGEPDEIGHILGSAIPELDVSSRKESFLITALLDLCAYIGDGKLFFDVENDARCHGIVPQYYRPLDTRGQFRIDGDDVNAGPNLTHFTVGSPV